MASRPCRRPHNHPICRSRSTGAATLHWPEPRPCRPVSKGGTANKPPGGNRARTSKSRRAARLLGKPRLLTQVRLPARCRHRPDPAPQKPPQKIRRICDLSLLQKPGAVALPALQADGRVGSPLERPGGGSPRKDATMKIAGMKYGAGRGLGRSAGVAVVVLLAAGTVSGWGLSTA